MTAKRADRADRILDVYADFARDYGHSPSVRDILDRVGLASTSAVHYHLKRLVRDGSLRYCPCECGRLVRTGV